MKQFFETPYVKAKVATFYATPQPQGAARPPEVDDLFDWFTKYALHSLSFCLFQPPTLISSFSSPVSNSFTSLLSFLYLTTTEAENSTALCKIIQGTKPTEGDIDMNFVDNI
jgi:hypothetical protein